MEKKYYIRTQGYNGDSLIWWRPNSCGYTSDLNRAGKYSKEEVESIVRGSHGDNIAYECEKLDKHPTAIFRTVNANYISAEDADIK